MFWFNSKKSLKDLEEKTENGFNSVRDDMEKVGKWIKHLDSKDKQLFDVLNSLKQDLSNIKDEVESLREAVDLVNNGVEDKQLFKKLPVLGKQTSVEDVQEAVQTAVQTDNFYNILKSLSSNERLLIFTLLNSDMKLSYEDLALMLGKEKSTVRGQINAIKQKSESLIEEIVEKTGKKRVYIPEEIKEKMQKYAKVRVTKKKKGQKSTENQ